MPATSRPTDLADAQASAEWAIAQLPSFAQRIGQWVAGNVDVRRVQMPSPATHDRIVAIPKAPLPLSFNVEIGAYIGALRASLDILATTLAARFDVPDDGDRRARISFPIASARALRAGYLEGNELVKRLPAAERAIMEGLKPYEGGSPPLWLLHQLDIVRKHRRLLAIELSPSILSMQGIGALAFEPSALAPRLSADEEAELGLIRAIAPDCEFKITPQVLIDEVDLLGGAKDAVGVVHELGRHCLAIIGLFQRR